LWSIHAGRRAKISIGVKGRVAGGDRPTTLLWRERLKLRLGAEVKRIDR
jgi:hypothetical protein